MRSAFLILLLGATLLGPPFVSGEKDNVSPGIAKFEERAEAEKMSRSWYRDLEVASLVLIVIVGGAAILWAVRRK